MTGVSTTVHFVCTLLRVSRYVEVVKAAGV